MRWLFLLEKVYTFALENVKERLRAFQNLASASNYASLSNERASRTRWSSVKFNRSKKIGNLHIRSFSFHDSLVIFISRCSLTENRKREVNSVKNSFNLSCKTVVDFWKPLSQNSKIILNLRFLLFFFCYLSPHLFPLLLEVFNACKKIILTKWGPRISARELSPHLTSSLL